MEDLKTISREEKIELLKALKLKELKQKENVLETFKPFPGQEKFLKSQARVRAVFCGNSWGKTTVATIELLWQHLNLHPHRDTTNTRHTWLIIPSLLKAEDYWTEIKKWCPPSKLPKTSKLGGSTIRRLDWPNGSITTIYSHDMADEKFESTNLSGIICDEPPPRKIWIAAYRGLRANPDYWAIMAGTPISEPWVYTDLYIPAITKADKTIEVFQGSSYENPHVTREFLKDFESKLTEDERSTRLYGEFASLQGRVYKEFDRKVHVLELQEWPEDWPVYMAIDPHSRKKSTAIWVGVTKDEELIIINETAGEDIEDLALRIKDIESSFKYRVVSRIIDNSGSAKDWTGQSAIDILSKHGIRVSAVRQEDKAVHDGIIAVKRLFKDRRLFMFENCLGCVSDFSLYGWAENQNEEKQGTSEKVRKTHDDYVDLVRYIAMRKPCHRPSLAITNATTSQAYKPRR